MSATPLLQIYQKPEGGGGGVNATPLKGGLYLNLSLFYPFFKPLKIAFNFRWSPTLRVVKAKYYTFLSRRHPRQVRRTIRFLMEGGRGDCANPPQKIEHVLLVKKEYRATIIIKSIQVPTLTVVRCTAFVLKLLPVSLWVWVCFIKKALAMLMKLRCM